MSEPDETMVYNGNEVDFVNAGEVRVPKLPAGALGERIDDYATVDGMLMRWTAEGWVESSWADMMRIPRLD